MFCWFHVYSTVVQLNIYLYTHTHSFSDYLLLSVQFSRSVMSDSATPWTAGSQASLSITNSRSLLRLMSIESVMPSNHPILYHPLLLFSQSFPASRSFLVSQLFTSGDQSIGASASASVVPLNIETDFL